MFQAGGIPAKTANNTNGWRFQNPPPHHQRQSQYQNYQQLQQQGMNHVMPTGGLRANEIYGGSSISMSQQAPSSSTLFPLSSAASPSYQQMYGSVNNAPYSSLQSSTSFLYGAPSPQPQPMFRYILNFGEKLCDRLPECLII